MRRAWHQFTKSLRRSSSRQPAGRLWVELLEDRALPSFVTAPHFLTNPKASVHTNPVAVAVGDFNRDGKLDVVAANSGTNDVALLRGNGSGSFSAPLNFPVGKNPVAIVTGDFNGDGKLDVATANKGDNTVSILIGRGNGTFLPAITVGAGTKPVALAVNDFNGDQHADLAVVNGSAGTVTILLGDGTGHFTAGTTVAVGSEASSVASDDFNGDGKPDLAVVGNGFDYLDICLNNGDGTFVTPQTYTTGFNANTVVLGDFNHDQVTDVAIACAFPSSGISVLLGNGNGTFQTFTQYSVGQNPATLAVADLNNDGIPDLVTANDQFGNNNVSTILGNGDETFGPAFNVLSAGQQPVAVATGDFNRDGLTDIVAADQSGDGGGISLLLGNGDGTCVAPRNLSVTSPGAVVSGDFTGDHITDLAVITNGTYQGVDVFPGLGNGSFGAPIQAIADTGTTNDGLAVGDFNHDDILDLAVANKNGVTVYPGNGNGTFGTGQTYATGTSPKWVAVADFNGDNAPDLVVADNAGSGGVYVLLNDGNGNFGTATPVATGGKAAYVATGDLDGDHHQDLVVVDNADNKVSVLLGDGNGGFGAPISFTTDNGPNSVAIGDFNGDGKLDLAVPTFFGSQGGSALGIYRNIGHGSFRLAARYSVGDLPIGVVPIDLNGDGKLDLVTADDFHDTVTVWYGNGYYTFSGQVQYVVGDRPSWLTATDFNGDGKPDLAVVDGNANSVTLLATSAPAANLRVWTSAASVTAGSGFNVYVQAFDSDNNLLPSYSGLVGLTSSDHAASLPGSLRFTTGKHGLAVFHVTPRTAGNITVTLQLGAVTAHTSVEVVPAAATHLVLTPDANITAGNGFNVTVTAYDAYGNVATGYTGTVHFTGTGPAALTSLPADYPFTLGDAGQHQFTVTLDKAGGQTLRVADLAKPSVRGSKGVAVAPGALDQFLLTGFPLTLTAGVTRGVTVTALDDFGNRLTGYVGTIVFNSSDGAAVLPGPYMFTTRDAGRHTFQLTLMTAGTSQWLEVADQTDDTLSGTLDGITIKAP